MGNEDTRREILLHSARLNRDFPVSVYRNETGDFIIMHRSLREVFDSIDSSLKPVEKEPVQIPIPPNDRSTLWVFRQDLVFNNGEVVWGIGSISNNEIATRPNLLREMFRPDIALNRAFDNAVLRWMRFELKVNDRIVRWFYGSESMDMRGAMPVTERNLTEVMASSKPAPFDPRGNGAAANRQAQPANPGQAPYGMQNTGGMPPQANPNAAQMMPGYRSPAPAPVPGNMGGMQPGYRQQSPAPAPAGPGNDRPVYGGNAAGQNPQAAAGGVNRTPPAAQAPTPPSGPEGAGETKAEAKNPMVRRVYFDHDRSQTRVETDMGSMLYSPDTHQWTGETLKPSEVPDLRRLADDASRLLGSDIAVFRGMLGI